MVFFSTMPCERESALASSWTPILNSMRRDPPLYSYRRSRRRREDVKKVAATARRRGKPIRTVCGIRIGMNCVRVLLEPVNSATRT